MSKRLILFPILALFCGPALAHRVDTLNVQGHDWETSGEVTKRTVDGKDSIQIRTGRAIRRDVSFRDGTIEFDLQVAPHRSFVYVQFRMQGDRDYEEIYFRPHKSGLPDAIQYSPVYKGASNWQLYHGTGSTAPADLTSNQWIRIRLVASGDKAAVFVGDSEAPQLVIGRLARPAGEGYVAIRSFLPGGLPAEVAIATFANFTVRPGHVPYEFEKYEPKPLPPGIIDEWMVSSPFAPAQGSVTSLPSDIVGGAGWQRLETEPSGLLVLGRHLPRLAGTRRPGVVARLEIRASEDGPARLNLGFSDEVSVFLNGRLLLYENDSYSPNNPRRDGLVGLDQTSIYLPLQKGRNELLLVIVDSFGGWGLMGQIEGRKRIEWEAK